VTKLHLQEIRLKQCGEAVSALRLRAASAVTVCLLPLRAAQPALDQLTPGNGKHTDVTSPPARRLRSRIVTSQLDVAALRPCNNRTRLHDVGDDGKRDEDETVSACLCGRQLRMQHTAWLRADVTVNPVNVNLARNTSQTFSRQLIRGLQKFPFPPVRV